MENTSCFTNEKVLDILAKRGLTMKPLRVKYNSKRSFKVYFKKESYRVIYLNTSEL